jgi:hypothetical protein
LAKVGDVFERFTEGAREVAVLAQDEARALKHNYIGVASPPGAYQGTALALDAFSQAAMKAGFVLQRRAARWLPAVRVDAGSGHVSRSGGDAGNVCACAR